MAKHRFLTIKECNFILKHYDHYSVREIARHLNVNPSAVRGVYRREGLRKCEGNGRFRKSHTPWNKGKKGTIPVNVTSFKPGQQPHNTVPVGTTRINKDGLLEIKFIEHKWRSLHSHLWIEAYGSIPEGHCVVFKQGVDKMQFTLGDLELVSRAQLLERNRLNRKNTTDENI